MASAQGIRAGKAYVEIGTNDSALNRGLRRAEARLKAFGKSVSSLGRGLANLGTAAAVPFAVSSKTFGDFESAMARVRALTNATGDDFAKLGALAKKLGAETIFSATQAAQAMGNFAQAGFSVQEIMQSVGPTLDLAATAQIEIADAARIAAAVMRGMGIEAADLGGVVDVLAKAANTANTDITQLGDAFKFVGPVAKTAGISFAEITAAIQILSDAGVQGEMAGTSLRGMILSLATPTDEAAKELARLGISVTDARGNFRSLTSIFAQFERALSGMGSGQKLEALGTIFPDRQAAGAAVIAAEGAAKLAAATKALGSSAGEAARVAGVQMDTLRGDVDILMSSVEGLGIEVGESLAPTLRKLATRLSEAANFVANLVVHNRELVTILGKATLGAIGIGAAMVGLGAATKVAAFYVGGLGKAINLVVGAVKGIALGVQAFTLLGSAIAFLLSPIGLVAAGVVALGAWFASTGFDGRKALDQIAGAFEAVRGAAVAAFDGLMDAGSAALGWLGGQLAAIPGLVSDAFNGLVGLADRALAGIGSAIGGAIFFFSELFPIVSGIAAKEIGKIIYIADLTVDAYSLLFSLIGKGAMVAFGIVRGAAEVALDVGSRVFEQLARAASFAWKIISGGIGLVAKAWLALFDFLVPAADAGFGAVATAATAVFSFIGNLLPDLRSLVGLTFFGIQGIITTAIDLGGKAFGGLWEAAKRAFDGIRGLVMGFPGWVASAFSAASSFVSGVFSGVGTAVMGMLSGVGNALASIPNAVSSAFQFLGGVFHGIVGDAKVAFAGIADALKAGDITLAAKVLWLTLRMEFQKGVNFLNALWQDWGTAAITVFQNFKFTLAGLMIDAWAAIQTAWIKGVGFISDIFNGALATILKTLNNFGAEFLKFAARAKAAATFGDAAAEINRIDAETANRNTQIDIESGKGAEARQAEIAQIEADRQAARQALADEQAAGDEARFAAAREALKGGEAELAKIREELAATVGEAKQKAAEVAKPTGSGDASGPGGALGILGGVASAAAGTDAAKKAADQFTPEGLDAALQATARKVDVTGSFSAAALGQKGVGTSIADRQLEQQKEQTKELKELNKKARGGQLVFGT